METSEKGFELLYEEGPCLVISKPGGVLTQAPRGIDSLEVRIKDYLKARDHKPGKVYLGICHRLDRPVSGVMVFCRHVRATRRVAEQFQERQVQKKYWAVVEGHVSPEEATWVDHMRKIPDVAQAEIVPAEHPDARRGVLHYRVLRRLDGGTLMEIELETGRMHQIRLQAAIRGYPVWGDQRYAQTEFGTQYDDPRERSIALHAYSLQFCHPMTREVVAQNAPLPDPWNPIQAVLGS